MDDVEQMLARAAAMQLAGELVGETLELRNTATHSGVLWSGGGIPSGMSMKDYFVFACIMRCTLGGEARPDTESAHNSRRAHSPCGQDGTTITVIVINCALCHLPHVDNRIQFHCAIPPIGNSCSGCRYPDDAHVLELCES